MGNWCEIYETGSKPKGGYGIQLPGLDMPTKILTAVDTVRNITNGMKGIIQGRISGAAEALARNPTCTANNVVGLRPAGPNPTYGSIHLSTSFNAGFSP